MAAFLIRVLVVDDSEPFRRVIRATLHNKLELQIIEASDGVDAIELAQILQPDLILMDIGLPKLNGIETARRIRELTPQSKILFVSQESSVDVIQAAFSVGASGYVVKIDAGSELAAAVQAVLRGKRFVGSRFAGHDFNATSDTPTSTRGSKAFGPLQGQEYGAPCRHEAGFYADDASLLEAFTQFIGAALKAGNAVIVVATTPHLDNLLPRLQAHGLDVAGAIEQGRYISLDAVETLTTFMVNRMPDPVRFFKVTDALIRNAAKSGRKEHPRVAMCGECAPILWAQGDAEAAIRLEHLWNEIAKTHYVDILCGYPLGSFHVGTDSSIFDRLCAAHSAVHSR